MNRDCSFSVTLLKNHKNNPNTCHISNDSVLIAYSTARNEVIQSTGIMVTQETCIRCKKNKNINWTTFFIWDIIKISSYIYIAYRVSDQFDEERNCYCFI